MGKGAKTLDAMQLGERDLDLYNEYLFLQSAVVEAQPIQDEIRGEEMKRQQQHDAATAASMKK